ncbi:MAG: MFS transporter [Sphingomonadales bacterium]|nr:MFS transporter [Sphingomonadales bacterium]
MRKESGLRLTLGVLLLVYIFNFLDRQVATILAEPIARELHLTDTDIGLMTGLSFALLYTALGLPIAKFADRPGTSRVRLIAVAVALWSVMTAVCGLARSFPQLLAARVGVGIGEAGCTPPAHSLISDKATPEARSRAFAIYQLGPPLGGLIGMVMGGLLADRMGWRTAFFVVGIPGLLLALLVLLVVTDPRDTRDGAGTAPPPAMSARAAFGAIWQSRAMRLMLLCAAFSSSAGYGVMIWGTIFFQRSHHLTAGQTGVWFGLVNGIGSGLGVWLGGHLGDWQRRKHGKRALLHWVSIALMASSPLLLGGLLANDWRVAMALFLPSILLAWLYVAPYYSAAQGLVPPGARATASATVLFVQNLIGLGLGPLVLGMASDWLKPTLGAESVRYVLFIGSSFGVIGGLLLLRASRHLPRELDRA